MVGIKSSQLELTRSAYLSMADLFLKDNMSLYEAYLKVEQFSSDRGLSSRYSSFESFKTARHREVSKCLENSNQ